MLTITQRSIRNIFIISLRPMSQAKVAIIGGTGLYNLDGELEIIRTIEVETPWGKPSSPITLVRTKQGHAVAFLSRHGTNHQFTPSTVPSRANIAALKSLGVETILAFSAVGSLRQEIAPRDFVIPNQVIDCTKGIRPSSFYDEGLVGHVGFGEPFDPDLNKLLTKLTENALTSYGYKVHSPKSMNRDVTLICMEGPAFSTRAESNMYRSFGGDVINMSCIPEAKLAKESEISYQMICMSTDYDAWRLGEESVTVETVVSNLTANSQSSKTILGAVLDKLVTETEAKNIGFSLKGSMKFAVSTKPEARDPEMLSKLSFLHPEHYKSEETHKTH